jgi:hypothetical protein
MSDSFFLRILGQTKLERRCRLIVSLCLALLLAGVFWWIFTVTDNLVMETARTTGRRLVDCYMLELHFNAWENLAERESLVRQMGKGLQSQSYGAEILTLEDTGRENMREPADPEEEQILHRLQQRLHQQADVSEGAGDEVGEAGTAVEEGGVETLGKGGAIIPVFEERFVRSRNDTQTGEYHYYQPVYWKPSCTICHRAIEPAGASSVEDGAALSDGGDPFRVVKISLGDGEIRQVLHQTRASLLAVGMVSTFVSMVVTFIALRLLIVRPLARQDDVIPPASAND